jgi:DnaJ family protein C protein 8
MSDEHDVSPQAEFSAKHFIDSNNTESQLEDQDKDSREEWEVQRDYHKTLADAAFRKAEYSTAIQEYTNAIELDPDYFILYSNRSASFLANGEKSKALADAKKCVTLKPEFVKGHNRLAASMMSLGRWNEARNVYKHVLDQLDEQNEVAKKGLEDCRIGELRKREAELEMIRLAQKVKQETTKEKEPLRTDRRDSNENLINTSTNQVNNENIGDDEDDLLNEFFEEVEDTPKESTIDCQKEKSENDTPIENKIQIQLNDLGDTQTQIQRLLRPNHEWYNLNPFNVLDISHEAPLDLLSRRYKALSLLLHPDKVKILSNSSADDDLVHKAQEAFEYVRKSMNSLKDEAKAKYFRDLVEQGMKQGKKDYENPITNHSSTLEQCQEKAVLKIFAEIERKRRDVERRKRNQEQREREQEDSEKDKLKKEHEFEKKWKDTERVEKRIGNWRDFTKDKRTKH